MIGSCFWTNDKAKMIKFGLNLLWSSSEESRFVNNYIAGDYT